jgi:hypothetical protein
MDIIVLADTHYHDFMDGFLTWTQMYEMFVQEDFPPKDEDLNVYQNIWASGLYDIVTRLDLMPYTNANRWEFSHLVKEVCTILNERKQPITSLNIEYIHI